MPQFEENSQKVYDKLGERPMQWGYLMFPDYFRDKPPDFHKQIIRNALSNKRLAIVAPRGHAKSTLVSFLYAFHALCFKKKHYIMLVGNTGDKTAEHIQNMTAQIRNNRYLKLFHGRMQFLSNSKDTINIQHDDGFTCRVRAIGIKEIGKLRGTKEGAYRPDLIILDDVDDDELVKNAERRRGLQDDIDTALFPMGDKHTQFLAVGTVLHDDCQIAKMVNPDMYPGWKKMFFRAVIDETTKEVLWDECKSYEELMLIKQHNPLTYAKEYQNDPVAGENMRFNREMFKYYKRKGNVLQMLDKKGDLEYTCDIRDCQPAIACDLAWSEKKEADESVILSAILTPQSDIIVWQYIHERGMRPEKFMEYLFGTVQTMKDLTGTKPPVGFEKAMLERVTQHMLKQEMKRRGYFITTKELKWESDKITRIETQLEPRYSQGTVYHRGDMGELEYQLLRFPSGVHDDIVDALQGVCQLLRFPKATKKEHKEDNQFDWLVKNAIPHPDNVTKQKRLGQFLFGKKKKGFKIPSKTTPF